MTLKYRTQGEPVPVPESVTISSTEYAVLRRAKLLLDTIDGGTDVYINRQSYGRYRWDVEIDDGLGPFMEGKGQTFQDAVEDALELEPVDGPWMPPVPAPSRWFRWLLVGASLSALAHWWLV